MDAIVIVGSTKDRDSFDDIYRKAVEAYNVNRGNRAVWIIFNHVAIRIFPGCNLESTKEDYVRILEGIKKSE